MVDFVRNIVLKFTPLEFETHSKRTERLTLIGLKFTPLEFETIDELEAIKQRLG